jgi:putative transposase
MYPTNISDSQYEIIKGIINDKRKRKYSLQSILNSIFYISRSGIQWRLLPKEFPFWQ